MLVTQQKKLAAYVIATFRSLGVACQMVALTLLLFTLTNLVCAYILFKSPEIYSIESEDEYLKHTIGAWNPKWPEMFKSITGAEDKDIPLARGGGLQTHTVLDFINEPADDAYRTVGFENIRHTSKQQTDAELKKILESGQSVWAFGGSTTFGWLVKDNETWPTYLDGILKKEGLRVLNFGINSSLQGLAVKRLVYLLQKGYRPRYVIFYHGMNDIVVTRNNYRSEDSYERLDVFQAKVARDTLVDFTYQGQLRNFVNGLPVFKLYQRYNNNETFAGNKANKLNHAYSIETIQDNKDANIDPVDIGELLYLDRNALSWYKKNPLAQQRKYVEYLRRNQEFVESISKAFGFKAIFIYQSFPYLDKGNNPFVLPSFYQIDNFAIFNELNSAARQSIAAHELRMHDFSDVLMDLDKPRYLDPGHYSKWGNEVIAQHIAPLLK